MGDDELVRRALCRALLPTPRPLSNPASFSSCSLHWEQRGEHSSEQDKARQFEQAGRVNSREPRERMHRRKMQLWRSPGSVWEHRENGEHPCCKTAKSFLLGLTCTERWGEAQRGEDWRARFSPWFSFTIHLLGWGTSLGVGCSLGLLRWLFPSRLQSHSFKPKK